MDDIHSILFRILGLKENEEKQVNLEIINNRHKGQPGLKEDTGVPGLNGTKGECEERRQPGNAGQKNEPGINGDPGMPGLNGTDGQRG